MSVIQIRKAQREGARLVLGLAGVSGSGKTYTAIQIAYGLAGYDSSKVGLLDTENRRGSLYADVLKEATRPTDEPFLIGDLYAPFSPQRYIDAILEFQKHGVSVLVVDSATHEWEGTGGCEEIAADTTSKIADWKRAKAEHKRFMNAALQCDMHIIFCIRAREKTDFSDPKKPRSIGVQPIQEKNFMFEMTASMLMQPGGHERDVLKCPAELVPIFGAVGRQKGYLNADHGAALRQWVQGGNQLDPTVETWRNRLQSNTEGGLAHINECIGKTPAPIVKKLGEDWLKTLRTAAKAYDDARAQASGEASAPAGVASLNAQIVDADPV